MKYLVLEVSLTTMSFCLNRMRIKPNCMVIAIWKQNKIWCFGSTLDWVELWTLFCIFPLSLPSLAPLGNKTPTNGYPFGLCYGLFGCIHLLGIFKTPPLIPHPPYIKTKCNSSWTFKHNFNHRDTQPKQDSCFREGRLGFSFGFDATSVRNF